MGTISASITAYCFTIKASAEKVGGYILNALVKAWPYALLAAGLILLGVLFWRYRRWQSGWLSGLIDVRVREMQRQTRRSWVEHIRLKLSARGAYWYLRSFYFRCIQFCHEYLSGTRRQLRDFYFPSLASFLAISFIILLFFVLPNGHNIWAHLHGNVFRNLTSALKDADVIKKIFEGLALIAVALIIFVAESIRDSKNPDRKRVLLRISYLWPLTLAVTLFPIGYLAGELTGVAAVLVLIICLSAVFAFSNIIRNLLDADAQERTLRTLLKERIRAFIMDSVRERVGNNILIQKLGTEIKINYTPSRAWLETGPENYTYIELPRAGWLRDINLEELQQIGRLLESQALKLGFGIIESEDIATAASQRGAEISVAKKEKRPTKKVYLLKRYREQLPPDSIFSGSRAILALPKEFANDSRLLEEVRRRAISAFRLTSAEPSSVAFRRELEGTKDQLAAAIRTVSLGAVEELRQTYLEIAEEFLETLHRLGGGYSAEQAQKERGNIFEGWNEIRWLVRDVRELLIVSAETNNVDVIGNIAFLPIAIAIRAVVAKDHLLFDEFTPFATFLYYLGKSKTDAPDVRRFMIERSWRYLKEVCEFYIPPINYNTREYEINFKDSQDFALSAFRVFQNLLKEAYDDDDIETFGTVLREFSRLFKHFQPQEKYPTSELIKFQLANTTNPSDQTQLRNELTKQEAKEAAARAISLGRDEVIFGLTAHILANALNDPKAEKHLKFYKKIESRLPNRLSRLSEIFESVTNYETSTFWQWSSWDLSADGEAHFIDTHSKLNRLFCVRALQLLGTLTADAAKTATLPPSEAVRMLLIRTDAQSLPSVLEQIRSNDEFFSKILTQRDFEMIEPLKRLLEKTKEAGDRAEEDQLILSPLNPSKLLAFTQKVIGARLTFGRLRPLMQKLEAFSSEGYGAGGTKIRSFGFNQLDDKGAFVKDYPVSYPGWGEAYGRGLAQGEDRFGFETLVSGTAVKLESPLNSLFTKIEEAIDSTGIKNPIIVHSLLSQLEFIGAKDNKHFVAKYRNDCPPTPISDLEGYSGVLRLGRHVVPVVSLFVPEESLKRKLVVADIARLARWHQFVPVDEPGDEEYVQESIFVRVRDLNVDNELRKKIIHDQPEYLREESDKDRYLRTRVVVNVYEKFQMEIVEPKQGVTFEIVGVDEI